jgi:hypothetical protein
MANMISKDTLKKILYFDIETAGIHETFSDLLLADSRLAKIWEKRCVWLRKNSGEEYKDATPDQLWLDKSSLHPEFAKIVCISIGNIYNDGNTWKIRLKSLAGHDEQEILRNFSEIIEKIKLIN